MLEKVEETTQEKNFIERLESISSKNNKAVISGILDEDFEYSHEFLCEKFYKTRVRVPRLSGTEDYVPIMISEMLMTDVLKSAKGKFVEIGGQFRSYNRKGEDGRKHLELFLFAKTINIFASRDEFEEVENSNLIYLDGYICKPPFFRITPYGKQITDVMIAVNRSYNKSDYVPCIAWGRVAHFMEKLDVGDRIKLTGRIQSRKYFKKFSSESEEGEVKEAYEISIMKMIKMD